jgi:rubrerythrin
MSMIENLLFIREQGIERFLEKEAEKWKCPECGYVISCHNGVCFRCHLEELRNREIVSRWRGK